MEILLKYFSELNPKQTEQFRMLPLIYRAWNDKINVISRKDIDNLYLHHVLHSLSIACFIRFNPGTCILDAGTGGGFPGIPLAILFPEVQFLLADSIGKKITVVNAIVKEIGLQNVTAKQIRVETLQERFDFIISRAVTNLPKFLSWVSGLLLPVSQNRIANGILYLKGGDIDEEVGFVRTPAQIIPLTNYFSEPFFKEKKIIYVAAH